MLIVCYAGKSFSPNILANGSLSHAAAMLKQPTLMHGPGPAKWMSNTHSPLISSQTMGHTGHHSLGVNVSAHQMSDDASSLSSKLIMASMASHHHHQSITSSCLVAANAFLPLSSSGGSHGQNGSHLHHHHHHHHHPSDAYFSPLDTKHHNLSPQIF